MRLDAIGILFVLVACGDKASDTAGGAESDTDADTDTDTDTGGSPITEKTTPQSLRLTVVGETGGPMGDVIVKFCNAAGCITESTGTDGVALFENAQLVNYSLEPVPPSGSGLGTPYVPLTFAPDEEKVLTMVMPPLAPAIDLGARAELDLDGLLVTVGTTDLAPPDPFQDPATEVAGVRVDPVDWPPINLSGTILAVWYLSPFDYQAAAGLPVRIQDSLGLADGATAHVWVGSYSAFDWVDGGTLTNNAGVLSGAALPLLSTVVVVQD